MILRFSYQNTVPYSFLFLGLLVLLFSFLSSSYLLGFIGLGIVFWGALFLYIKPAKYVKSELLSSTSISTLVNIEKLLTNANAVSEGIYLPPKRLQDYTSSLVFVPMKPNGPLPTTTQTDPKKLKTRNPAGLLITPSGLALSKLLEREMKKSFTETSLNDLQAQLPRLFDELEITEHLYIQSEENRIVVTIRNHVLKDLCLETSKLERTQKAMGCPLSSALACIFAKATGKPIRIEAEEIGVDATTTIHFRVLEG